MPGIVRSRRQPGSGSAANEVDPPRGTTSRAHRISASARAGREVERRELGRGPRGERGRGRCVAEPGLAAPPAEPGAQAPLDRGRPLVLDELLTDRPCERLKRVRPRSEPQTRGRPARRRRSAGRGGSARETAAGPDRRRARTASARSRAPPRPGSARRRRTGPRPRDVCATRTTTGWSSKWTSRCRTVAAPAHQPVEPDHGRQAEVPARSNLDPHLDRTSAGAGGVTRRACRRGERRRGTSGCRRSAAGPTDGAGSGRACARSGA